MPPPRGIVQQLDQYLHRRPLLGRGERVVVACSGGADSVALLRLLHSVNQSNYWQWKLVVAHVEHGIRGTESRADAAFVRTLATKLRLPFQMRRLELKKLHKKVSEATARDARRKALAAMSRGDTVVLAHHSDDQVETILMRLLRGSGLEMLAGMPEIVVHQSPKLRLVRPLLHFSRTELRDYLASIGQDWREDATNAQPDFLRNRIREELLPLLRTYQPAIGAVLGRLAAQARDLQQTMAGKHSAGVTALKRSGKLRVTRSSARGNSVSFAQNSFTMLENFSQARILQSLVRSLGGPTLTHTQITRAQSALAATKPSRTPLAGGIMLEIRAGRARITPQRSTTPSASPTPKRRSAR